MSAVIIEAARIAGALKCVDALRKLEQSAENDDPGETAVGLYSQRQAAVQAMVAALGPMTPEQEGAFAVLAEYIHTEICGLSLDIGHGLWIPLSAMTDEERQAMAIKEDADNAASDAAFEQTMKAANKVVSIAERRAAQ